MYRFSIDVVLAIHLAWILWVIFGALWTRGRPLLTCFHVASLLWGIIVELSSLPCPLTLAEDFFETKTGLDPTQGGFLVPFLNAMVYPNLPEYLLVYLGVAVCAFNLAIYLRRLYFYRRGWVKSRARAQELPRNPR